MIPAETVIAIMSRVATTTETPRFLWNFIWSRPSIWEHRHRESRIAVHPVGPRAVRDLDVHPDCRTCDLMDVLNHEGVRHRKAAHGRGLGSHGVCVVWSIARRR